MSLAGRWRSCSSANTRDDASLHPRAVRHVLDLGLARMEMPLPPVLGQDREAAEVAEAIVIDRDDLAGYLMFAVRRRATTPFLARPRSAMAGSCSGRLPKW